MHGAVAQVGARFLGMEEVAGSTPASSTTLFANKGGTAENSPLDGRVFLYITVNLRSRG